MLKLNKIKIIFLCFKFITLIFLISALYYQLSSNNYSIQTETFDRYPRYLEKKEMLSCIPFAFDACTGEACLKDNPNSMDLNECSDDKICETRTRNLNYFMDCVDAQWLYRYNFSLPQLSRIITYILSFIFLFFGFYFMRTSKENLLFNLENTKAFKYEKILDTLIISILPLFISAYSVNVGVIFRSGKLFGLVLLTFLFSLFEYYQNYKTKITNFFAQFLILLFLYILILSDELAVILTLTFTIYLFLPYINFHKIINFKKLKIKEVYENNSFTQFLFFLISTLIFYIVFKFSLESFLTKKIANINLRQIKGGYTDFFTFIRLHRDLFVSTLKTFFNQINFLVGAHNNYGRDFFTTSITFLILISFIIFLKNEYKRNIRKFYTYLIIITLWIVVVYVMALRHNFIVLRSQYGLGYYHGIFILISLLFIIKKFILQNVNFQKYPFVLLIIFCVWASMHSYKFRSSQIQVQIDNEPISKNDVDYYNVPKNKYEEIENKVRQRKYNENQIIIKWIKEKGNVNKFSIDELKIIKKYDKFTKIFKEEE